MISTLPLILRASIVEDLSAILRLHRDDPDAAGLASLQVLREAQDATLGFCGEPGVMWSDLLDPSGLVRYCAGLAVYGHAVPVGTRDIPGNVIPFNPDVPTCARIVVERLHRVPPVLLAEMAILRAEAEPSAAQLARAREIAAQVWGAR